MTARPRVPESKHGSPHGGSSLDGQAQTQTQTRPATYEQEAGTGPESTTLLPTPPPITNTEKT